MSYALLQKSAPTGPRLRQALRDVSKASEIGALETRIWLGVNQIFSMRKNFLLHLSRALDSGETLEFTGGAWQPSDITCWVTGGQSNPEGPASKIKFLAWLAIAAPAAGMTVQEVLDLIGPVSLVGGNTSGAGGDLIIGPAHGFAALNAMRTRKPQFIVDTATGTQSVNQSWGTNGEDGTYATQRNHANVYDGAPGATVPSVVEPRGYSGSIKRVLLWGQGEQDSTTANASLPTHFRARALQLINKHVTDYPTSPVPGIVVYGLAPTNWGNGTTHPWHSYVRDELLTLANPSGSETSGIPVVVDQYADADWISGDAPHIDFDDVVETRGWMRMVRPRFNAMVAAGWI